MNFYVEQSLPNENSLESIRDPIIYEYTSKIIF